MGTYNKIQINKYNTQTGILEKRIPQRERLNEKGGVKIISGVKLND